MGIIFDLDQTLINSSIAVELRRSGNWPAVYKLVPSLIPFEGINELINKLSNKNIPMCIVTSSPRSYCERIVNYWGWSDLLTVCYHDTTRRKPYPDPIQKGIELLGINPNKIISIGDEAKDIIASKRAGTITVGVTWGITDKSEIEIQNPDYIFDEVNELDNFLDLMYK